MLSRLLLILVVISIGCTSDNWDAHKIDGDYFSMSLPKGTNVHLKRTELSEGKYYLKFYANLEDDFSLVASVTYYSEVQDKYDPLTEISKKIYSSEITCPTGKTINRDIEMIAGVNANLIRCLIVED